MYNPNQDIVAGRTASQIESAKRRAVKGGGRKRCKKGKSCGSTCINGVKVCLVDLPWVSSNGLTKVVKEIQSSSKGVSTHPPGIEAGMVQPLPQGSLDEVSKNGKAFMDRYRNRLDSAFSIWNKREAWEDAITRKIKEDESLTLKQKMRLRVILERIIERGNRAKKRSSELMEEIRAELLKTKLSESDINGIMGRLKINGKSIPDNDPLIKQVRGQVEEFARMFNGKGLLEVVDSGGEIGRLINISVSPQERPYQWFGSIVVNGNPTTTFHEIAHIVEHGRGWLFDYAKKWRDSKAFTVRQVEKAKGMDEIIKGSNGKLIPFVTQDLSGRNLPVFRLMEMPINKSTMLSTDEIAVVDRFMDTYMGKVYGGKKATEIISMGMEKFASVQDMSFLYANHPDLFETIVGLALT